MANDEAWVARLNNVNQDRLPGMVGMVVTHAEPGLMRAKMEAKLALLAPIGFLFAPALVALADTLCAYGTILPEGANNFTTAELKCNFMSTIREGTVLCEAKLVEPTHVVDFPADISPLAKRSAADPRIAERFETYCFGMRSPTPFPR